MNVPYVNDREFHERVIEEVLEAYPEKAVKNRRKHFRSPKTESRIVALSQT